MKRRSFASLSFESKKKPTRRERFLGEMDKVVPWAALLARIEPSYPTSGRRGRPPMPAATMLRIHFMQQWYALSDPAMEDALYEIESMRRFAGLELNEDAIPDETTILKFRRFLEQHGLAAKMLAAVNGHLSGKGLLLRQGTIVDATIIQAPSSTKNASKQRDPEMRQTKKGQQWYFGMKAHIGVDVESGLVHTVTTTPANVGDVTEVDKLLHGQEKSVYADAGYQAKQASELATGAASVCNTAGADMGARVISGGQCGADPATIQGGAGSGPTTPAREVEPQVRMRRETTPSPRARPETGAVEWPARMSFGYRLDVGGTAAAGCSPRPFPARSTRGC